MILLTSDRDGDESTSQKISWTLKHLSYKTGLNIDGWHILCGLYLYHIFEKNVKYTTVNIFCPLEQSFGLKLFLCKRCIASKPGLLHLLNRYEIKNIKKSWGDSQGYDTHLFIVHGEICLAFIGLTCIYSSCRCALKSDLLGDKTKYTLPMAQGSSINKEIRRSPRVVKEFKLIKGWGIRGGGFLPV